MMGIPNPYFSIGETVIIHSDVVTQFNGDEDKIVDYKFGQLKNVLTGRVTTGYGYKLQNDPARGHTHHYWGEWSLRKKYDPGMDWESLKEDIKQKVEAL